MSKRAVLFGGMGYPLTELPAGMPTLKAELEKLGFEVLLVNWSHRQEAFNFMHGFAGVRITAGDSLGAGSAGQFPADWGGGVDYAAGFQPSDYDARSINHVQTISRCIARAHCIMDPYWIDTGGLGHSRWAIAPGAKTYLSITEHRSPHPDDWQFSQQLVLADIHHLLGSHK